MTAVLIAILTVVGVGAAWLAHNQYRIQGATTAMCAAVRRPAVDRPVDGQVRRLASRETVGTALALLTVGLTAACGLAYVSDSVQEFDGITLLDQPIVVWLASHRDPAVTVAMRAVSAVGSPGSTAVEAVAVCAAVAWRRRSWLPIAMVGIGLAGFATAVSVVKLAMARERPPLPYSVMSVAGYSFPSGHAMGVTTTMLVSAWVLAHWVIRSFRDRIAIWTTALAIIAGVGFSRMYLGVHYLSDVIAGWLLGTIWTCTLLTCASLWCYTHDRPVTDSDACPRQSNGHIALRRE